MSYTQSNIETEIYNYSDDFSESLLQSELCSPELYTPLSTSSKKINKQTQKKTKESNRKQKSFWQPEEDAQVMDLIAEIGFKWTQIGRVIGGRTGKQVRDRYNHTLNPEIKKTKWTSEEDKLLVSLYHKIGNKWCQIAEQIPGRTENQVKNRFHSKLKDLATSEGSTVNETQASSPCEGLSPIVKPQEFETFEPNYDFEPKLIKFISHENMGFDFSQEIFYERETLEVPQQREVSAFESLVESILRGYPNF